MSFAVAQSSQTPPGWTVLFWPPHDKTNKMTVRPAKTQIMLYVCIMHVCTFIRTPFVISAQTDLSLRWAHMPFCWFCHEPAHLYLLPYYKWCPNKCTDMHDAYIQHVIRRSRNSHTENSLLTTPIDILARHSHELSQGLLLGISVEARLC